jgi:hypothetical protein
MHVSREGHCPYEPVGMLSSAQAKVELCKLLLICHFYLSLFCLEVKNFHRSTDGIHITKDIGKMARMGDIAPAASD